MMAFENNTFNGKPICYIMTFEVETLAEKKRNLYLWPAFTVIQARGVGSNSNLKLDEAWFGLA